MMKQLTIVFVWVILTLSSKTSLASSQERLDALFGEDFSTSSPVTEGTIFTLEGELGFLRESGNTQASSLTAGINAQHETAHISAQYFAELLYKESEISVDGVQQTDVTAQRWFGFVQNEYKLTEPNNRLFVYGDYENDRFSGYNYRSTIAAGWAQQRWNNETSSFRYSIGPGYLFAKEDNQLANRPILRGSINYTYTLSSGARLRQFISSELSTENSFTRTISSLTMTLIDKLALKVAFKTTYQSNANETSDALNTETTIAMVYQFF